MARTAVTQLQQQIEEVRREAFAAGYATAMRGIRELASHPAPVTAIPTAPRGGRPGPSRKSVAAAPRRRRRAVASDAAARHRTPAARGRQRGGNAQAIEEILRVASPRALRQAEIRKALQERGIEVAFTSIRHALSQLATRNAAEQVGDSRTWRHRAGAS